LRLAIIEEVEEFTSAQVNKTGSTTNRRPDRYTSDKRKSYEVDSVV